MAKEKKPSIYDDRGTIGSSEELDEYGVWVKSEPQDLSAPGVRPEEASAFAGDISGTDALDLQLAGIDELPDFDTLEEEVLGAAAGTKIQDSAAILPDTDSAGETEDEDGAVFNFGDLTGQFDTIENLEEPAEDGGASYQGDVFEADTAEEADTAAEIPDDVFSGLEPADFPDGEKPGPEDSALDFAEDIPEDIPAEDSAPEAAAESFPEEMFPEEDARESLTEDILTEDFSTEDFPAEDLPAAAKTETPKFDLSTQLLMKIADELSSIRTELSGLKKEFSVLKAPAPAAESEEERGSGEEDDEKISLTGDELNNILNTADFTEEAGADATIELSEDLDLAETENPTDDFLPAAADSFLEDEASAEDLGFSEIPALSTEPEEPFAEETLENIGPDIEPVDLSPGEPELVTTPAEEAFGDFPETDAGEQDPEEFEVVLEEFPEAEPGPPETDFVETSDSGIDTPVPAFAEADEDIFDFDMEENDEIKQLMETGAEPMTFAPSPEDADYLAEDPLADIGEFTSELPAAEDLSVEELSSAEEFPPEIPEETPGETTEDGITLMSEEDFDLSKAVIDEPDLSADIQENPLEEPSPEDISISLDLSGFESEDGGTEIDAGELDTIELDLAEENLDLDSGEDIDLSAFGETENAEADDFDSSSGADLALIPEGLVIESPETNAEEIPFVSPESDEEIAEDELPGGGQDLLDLDEKLTEEIDEELPEDSRDISGSAAIPTHLKQELKTVLTYMDQLLESLPDNKIEEFARSEYFDTYKKLFKELGIA